MSLLSRLVSLCAALTLGMAATQAAERPGEWRQWRGPNRDGIAPNQPAWPATLQGERLAQRWRVPMGPSYSSPVVAADRVFTTETRDKAYEVVTSLDRVTGKVLWRAEWKGAIEVPFFAAANGSWIRATPAYDGKDLYVAGMRDVLVCLDGKTGKERWRVDFTERYKTPVPEFGLVCSPLVEGDALYIQAANSTVKLEKATGKTVWRSMATAPDIMTNGSFSCPVLSTVGGKRQLLVQSREKLAGLNPVTGEVLWEQKTPSFRGMAILTPAVWESGVFTSAYGGRATYLDLKPGADGKLTVAPRWDSGAQGYMSSPVVIGGHAYLHLRSNRIACIDLRSGKETWTSDQPYGKYMSMVAQGNRILALDQRGILYLLKANPEKMEILDQRKIADGETWAHLAVAGDEIIIRELSALTAFRWK